MRVAATQFKCGKNVQENWKNAEQLVRNAAKDGAQIILLQELFSNVYFCQEQDPKWYLTAIPSPLSSSSSSSCCSCSEMEGFFEWACGLAKELGVVLPVSFFEKAGNCYFNSLVVVDAGSFLFFSFLFFSFLFFFFLFFFFLFFSFFFFFFLFFFFFFLSFHSFHSFLFFFPPLLFSIRWNHS